MTNRFLVEFRMKTDENGNEWGVDHPDSANTMSGTLIIFAEDMSDAVFHARYTIPNHCEVYSCKRH